MAKEFDDDDGFDSSFLIRPLVMVFMLVELLFDHEVEYNHDDFMEPFRVDVELGWGGVLIDAILAFAMINIVTIAWPVMLLVLIFGVPVQAMHVRNKKKREFLEKLKGEEV